MRWIITIGVFYLMVLSSLPCSDGINQCNDTLPKIDIAQSHEHSKDNDDNCSPFCYCNCCSISFASYNFKSFEIKQPKITFSIKKITLRDYTIIPNYYGSIWNPPKLTV